MRMTFRLPIKLRLSREIQQTQLPTPRQAYEVCSIFELVVVASSKVGWESVGAAGNCALCTPSYKIDDASRSLLIPSVSCAYGILASSWLLDSVGASWDDKRP